MSPRPAVVVLLLAAGCFSDALPPKVLIRCQAPTDCPEGYVCRPALGQCVDGTNLDQTPPALAAPAEVLPAVAGAGASLTVSFRVGEPLARDPVVRVEHDALARGQGCDGEPHALLEASLERGLLHHGSLVEARDPQERDARGDRRGPCRRHGAGDRAGRAAGSVSIARALDCKTGF